MIHFVVHDEGDAVGVVVVEGVKKGQDVIGWIMDQDKELKIKTVSDIPIGHKLAIKALKKDDTVI
jgi:(2R)-sulfolactate sulfo-lyase subunit alpha